jgi:hypothetical protein
MACIVGIGRGEWDLSAYVAYRSASSESGGEGAYMARGGATSHAIRSFANTFVYLWGKMVT